MCKNALLVDRQNWMICRIFLDFLEEWIMDQMFSQKSHCAKISVLNEYEVKEPI